MAFMRRIYATKVVADEFSESFGGHGRTEEVLPWASSQPLVFKYVATKPREYSSVRP